MFFSSSGSTSFPYRSVKKSVVSKSPRKVVQSTTLTQQSSLAILLRPPAAISSASFFRVSGDEVLSSGRDCSISSMEVPARVSANSVVNVSAT
jgi:hypothetical protein